MRKNGSRMISIKQYMSTDLFVFAIILAIGEVTGYLAAKAMPAQALFTVSFTIAISLVVMFRWGWPGAFYPVAGGLLFCVLNGANGYQYACYTLGNAFAALMLIPRYLIGTKVIAKKWWRSALYALGGWVLTYLGRSIIWAIAFAISPKAGCTAATGFVEFALGDLLGLLAAVLVVIILRRFDGMFEGQRDYLIRIDKERRERMRRDEFGDEAIEIDDETLEILRRDSDLYDR